MGQNLARYELKEADVVIRPQVGNIGSTDFVARHDSILEGEKRLKRHYRRFAKRSGKPRESDNLPLRIIDLSRSNYDFTG